MKWPLQNSYYSSNSLKVNPEKARKWISSGLWEICAITQPSSPSSSRSSHPSHAWAYQGGTYKYFFCPQNSILTIFCYECLQRKKCYKYLQTNFFLRSQILFLLVFLTRYMDVFTHFISMYNTSIKIFFIISTTTNIYLVFVKYAGTISSDMDTFRYVLVSVKIEWKWAEIFQNRVSYFGSSSTCSFCQPWLQFPRGFPPSSSPPSHTMKRL